MKTACTFVVTAYFIAATAYQAFAQAGTLDLTFGTNGKVTTDFGGTDDRGYAVAIQSDGKIIVLGTNGASPNENIVLARYNTNGSLDFSFGSAGKVITDFGNEEESGRAIVVQNDGNILVTGTINYGAPTNNDFLLVRYHSNGSLDNGFGVGGKVITDFNNSSDMSQSIALQIDGKIVLAGYTGNGVSDFALVRYNNDGSLDNTFGSGGKVTTDFAGDNDFGNSVAIQSDGKIVVGGYTFVGVNEAFAVARYTSNGILDSSFGSGGKVSTPLGFPAEFGYSLAIQTDGKIILAGDIYIGHYDFGLVRYKSDGSLDSAFGNNGKVTTVIGSYDDKGYSVAIQGDGKIVVAGYSNNGTNNDFALVRYFGNGSLDSTFGSGGIVTTDFAGANDNGMAVAIQNDDKIVVAGNKGSIGSRDFALARYNGNVVGIDEILPEHSFFISPNPTRNTFTISLNNQSLNNSQLTIFDVTGRIVHEQTINSKHSTIICQLSAGVYFVRVEAGERLYQQKLVVE